MGLTTQFNICLTSGKKIKVQNTLEPRIISIPNIFGFKKRVQVKAQDYFDTPCEAMVNIINIRNNFIRIWKSSDGKY